MVSRVISKSNLQAMLKACRFAGLKVVLHDDGGSKRYTVHAGDELVLQALNGSRSYLVRLNSNLFQGDS